MTLHPVAPRFAGQCAGPSARMATRMATRFTARMSARWLGHLSARFALALACAGTVSAAHAGPVAVNGALTDLGVFAAGRYTLAGSGLVDVCGSGSAVMRPDGQPDTTVSCPPLVADFNPDGSYTADGFEGRAGQNARIGALIGTLNANAYTGNDPSAAQADDWFLIGQAMTLTLATAGHIYASVNDTYYLDNSGGFSVDVQNIGNPVPEPTSLALVLLAFGAASLSQGRRGGRPAAARRAAPDGA